jgi:Homeodomain-like domain
MGQIIEIRLTAKQREELEAIVARPSESAGLVRRARVVLLSASGLSGEEIALRLDLSGPHVSKIRSRFRTEGVQGLAERPKAGRKDHAVPAATVERIVELAMSPPPAGRSRWTTRLLGKQVARCPGRACAPATPCCACARSTATVASSRSARARSPSTSSMSRASRACSRTADRSNVGEVVRTNSRDRADPDLGRRAGARRRPERPRRRRRRSSGTSAARKYHPARRCRRTMRRGLASCTNEAPLSVNVVTKRVRQRRRSLHDHDFDVLLERLRYDDD